jgi:FkbM family methyltransferase
MMINSRAPFARSRKELGMAEDALIYDVGAHKGEDTEFYLVKGFSVVAIEAVPELCELISQKYYKYIKENRLIILNIAVAPKAGKVDFYIDTKKSVWGTMNLDWVARNRSAGGGRIRRISVDSAPLSDIIEKYGTPRYCKIDIEGSDLDALKSLRGAGAVPPFISIESEMKNWARLVEEFSVLIELGYHRFKVVDQGYVNLQKCPHPSLEGTYCNHVFEVGSSGLFGNELPGRWLDFFEALEVYKGIFCGYALNGDNGLFSRRTDIFHLLARVQVMIAHIRGFKSYHNPAYNLPFSSWYDTHAAQ